MLEAAFFAKFAVTVELVVLSTSWLIGFFPDVAERQLTSVYVCMATVSSCWLHGQATANE